MQLRILRHLHRRLLLLLLGQGNSHSLSVSTVGEGCSGKATELESRVLVEVASRGENESSIVRSKLLPSELPANVKVEDGIGVGRRIPGSVNGCSGVERGTPGSVDVAVGMLRITVDISSDVIVAASPVGVGKGVFLT